MAIDKTTLLDYAERFRNAVLSRRSLRAAAYGAAILGAVGAGSTAISVTTASLSPAQAQTMMIAPPVGITPPVSEPTNSTAIPKEQCNYLFDTATDSYKKHGKEYTSDITRVSLRRFFESVPGSKVIDCAGPREIAWQNDGDYAFVIALADDAHNAFKGKVDFRMDYGFRPAAKPANAAVSQRASAAAAPAIGPGS